MSTVKSECSNENCNNPSDYRVHFMYKVAGKKISENVFCNYCAHELVRAYSSSTGYSVTIEDLMEKTPLLTKDNDPVVSVLTTPDGARIRMQPCTGWVPDAPDSMSGDYQSGIDLEVFSGTQNVTVFLTVENLSDMLLTLVEHRLFIEGLNRESD